MATTSRKSTSSSKKSTTSRKTSGSRKTGNYRKNQQDSALNQEIVLIMIFAAMVLLFCCNFGLIGPVGEAISGFMFGLLGFPAYIAPILIFIAIAFGMANAGNPHATRRLIAGAVLFLVLGIICDLLVKNTSSMNAYDWKAIYDYCKTNKKGGGLLAGSVAYFLHSNIGTVGTVLVSVLLTIISIIILTEKSFLRYVRQSSERFREQSAENAYRRKELAEQRRLEYEENRARREDEQRVREEERHLREEERKQRDEERRQREEERRLRAEGKENDKILRREQRKVTGVTLDTSLPKPKNKTGHRDDIHEITYADAEYAETDNALNAAQSAAETAASQAFDFSKINISSVHQMTMQESIQATASQEPVQEASAYRHYKDPLPVQEQKTMMPHQQIRVHKDGLTDGVSERQSAVGMSEMSGRERVDVNAGMPATNSMPPEKKPAKKYMFPPLSRLQKGVAATGDSTAELKETALRLQQTLNTFGVKVTITDISQGPSVTRYELQPEQGVKVSKIVGLADDIKLNLAATDIRIEAPIPGKAAVGIEVPNKENMPVALRDLLESKEFKEFPSNIAFAVGKDISGKTVVSDIAKMPHMLIAGSTGSGKSVCINTLIMSILYKAHPDDVKLIMVDPKVVELSVYNGIPHLLIPVVTDPKKASAALHWAVSEMEDRYRKFADLNVRDLKGYNQKVESMQENGGEATMNKLPQIVIIVDELADLMMVSPGEVEDSICRLAQLARACGIHLIIATQRPSVDVITGLIKANMPSRVAFAVSSGVDSRTILDMNGAEKLLGKGDMLFYPQGYSKPARIQGAFVSDREVTDVVDFLKNQALGNTYAEDIEAKIQNIGSSSGSAGGASGGGNDLDEYFEQAARFIIDKDKASIGMLQRVLKIGFNRAARIMDQLCEYGVVGEEEGTKPRKVLMSMEQFEQLIDEVI